MAERDAPPEWADRRTIEWCAAICDATAVRVLAHERRRGAEVCAAQLRWYLQNDPRPLPPGRSLVAWPARVHILRHGFPLCRFSAELPCDWPEGHRWTGLDAVADANCADCLVTAFIEACARLEIEVQYG